ncbi:MAG TPA: ArsR family transcriptional regulator [Ktedonobacteraceae bacterium]|nr:ArsR family transcriptional regulator [Ktedonobacteraceae bacterium]
MSWNQHFFTSTRGRIVLLLRRSPHTVDELAQNLELTDNAVRAHLNTLERDGLIRQTGARRGGSKPALVYALAPEADQLFPKAYKSVLQRLLEVLHERLTTEQLVEIMQLVGRRIASQWKIPPAHLQIRLQHALEILNELGGLAELEETGENYLIHGYSCPLAAVVPDHPEICQLTQALLSELLGQPVKAQCSQDMPTRCCFITPRSP